MALVVRCNNGIVTDEYLNIIGNSLEQLGISVDYTDDFTDAKSVDKNEIIVVARTIEAFKLIVHGYKKVIVWFQGIEPEESYMIHKSKLRYWILSFMEKAILNKGFFFLFVSDEMIRHYENKYQIKIEKKRSYVMPCLNTCFHPEAFTPNDKYLNNIFVYTGSLAVWQKFEDTAKAYKQIEDSGIQNCEFWVLTKDQTQAKKILDQYGIVNYRIDYYSNLELPKVLSKAKYGFIIREDTPVNRVATPTKISTYLSCGLIPIYSNCLSSFSDIASRMNYTVCFDKDYIKTIKHFESKHIRNDDILFEYKKIYNDYFDSALHKDRLALKIQKVIKW